MADEQNELHGRFMTIMTGLCLVVALLGFAALLADEMLLGVTFLFGSGVVLLALWLARNLPPPRQTNDNKKEVA